MSEKSMLAAVWDYEGPPWLWRKKEHCDTFDNLGLCLLISAQTMR